MSTSTNHISDYDLRMNGNEYGGNGSGSIILDGEHRRLDIEWRNSADTVFTIGGQHVPPGELRDLLTAWITTPRDAVVNELRDQGADPDDGYYATICNGKITSLIAENLVLVGTLVPDR